MSAWNISKMKPEDRRLILSLRVQELNAIEIEKNSILVAAIAVISLLTAFASFVLAAGLSGISLLIGGGVLLLSCVGTLIWLILDYRLFRKFSQASAITRDDIERIWENHFRYVKK